MKAKVIGNRLLITTDIKVEDLKAVGNRTTLRDDKGNILYTLMYAPSEIPTLGKIGMVANTAEDGNVASLFIMPENFDLNAWKLNNSDALIAASTFIPQMAEKLNTDAEKVNSIFED